MNSFHCSVLSRNSVTFRAKAITPSERDMSLLRVSLEDWVYSAPTLHAGGLSLMVDSQCPVFVSPLNEIDYCAVQNSLLSDGRPTAATATGGLVALVSAAASLVTAIIATHY